MPKYWGKQIFTHRRFPEVGQKQKTERKRREKEEKKRKEERLNDGDNNGQATHGARKPLGPIYDTKMVYIHCHKSHPSTFEIDFNIM